MEHEKGRPPKALTRCGHADASERASHRTLDNGRRQLPSDAHRPNTRKGRRAHGL